MKRYQPLLFVLLTITCLLGFTPVKERVPRLGIVETLEHDSIVYAAGFRMLGESVGRTISPAFTNEQFRANKARMKAAKCHVAICNIFFGGGIKIAGPAVNEARVLGYADTVFARAKEAGVKMIILGSGGARRIPAGYDGKKAQDDFVVLCRKMAAVAAKYKMRVALESLEATETNFIITLKQAAEIVRAVNHPAFRLNADIFHMMREGEGPQSIVDAADVLIYCEVAEKESRTLPGVKGDDLKPYLRALRKAKFTGDIFIEGYTKNPAMDIPLSFTSLTRQLKEVYAE